MTYKEIFKKQFKDSLVYLILIMLTSFIWLLLYNDFINHKEQITTFLVEVSPEKLKGMGINLENLFNPLSYYGLYLNFGIIIYALLAAKLAINTLLANQIEENIILTKPIERKKFLTNKILIALLVLLLNFIIIFFFLLIVLLFYNVNHLFINLFLIQFGLLLSMFSLFSLILLITCFIPKAKIMNILSFTIVLILTVLAIIYKTTNLKILGYLNPLCYFDTSFTILNHRLSFDYLVAVIALSIFSFTFTFSEYEAKELGGK